MEIDDLVVRPIANTKQNLSKLSGMATLAPVAGFGTAMVAVFKVKTSLFQRPAAIPEGVCKVQSARAGDELWHGARDRPWITHDRYNIN